MRATGEATGFLLVVKRNPTHGLLFCSEGLDAIAAFSVEANTIMRGGQTWLGTAALGATLALCFDVDRSQELMVKSKEDKACPIRQANGGCLGN